MDVTAEHRISLCALVAGFDDSAELSDVLGSDAVSEARERRKEQIAAIDAGLLVREIFFVAASK